MLVKIADVLSAGQLDALRRSLEEPRAPWVDGRATAGHQGATVKNNRQLDESSATARDLGGLVIAELERNAAFISVVLPHRVYPPMFNRYTDGMQFGTHVDGAVRAMPGSGQKLRTDLSATLFLSPPESYDGGELIIEGDLGGESLKLPAGALAVYTSTSRHRVAPVTRGVRLACVFWIQSLIREDVKREQLFELDRTIQRLTALQSDGDCLVRLAGHYHSLLRLWTEL
jgi:PKHD-type hydroxylase